MSGSRRPAMRAVIRRFPWWVYALALLCVCGGISGLANRTPSTTHTPDVTGSNQAGALVSKANPPAQVSGGLRTFTPVGTEALPTVSATSAPPAVSVPTAPVDAGTVPAPTEKPSVAEIVPTRQTETATPVQDTRMPTAILVTPTMIVVAMTEGIVTRVVDGDTLDVSSGGKVRRVRIIGVDAPEVVDPGKPVMCYGREASAETKRLVDLAGGKVLLEKDVSETDRYGRLLRYVWLEHPDGRRMLNLELVKGGFAQVHTYPPDVKYKDLFLAEQRKAQEASAGLWGACGAYGVALATPTAEVRAATTTSESASGGSKGLKYDPFGPDRDCGDFDTYEEAYAFFKAAGGPARDPHRLDADHDGIPCESLPGAP